MVWPPLEWQPVLQLGASSCPEQSPACCSALKPGVHARGGCRPRCCAGLTTLSLVVVYPFVGLSPPVSARAAVILIMGLARCVAVLRQCQLHDLHAMAQLAPHWSKLSCPEVQAGVCRLGVITLHCFYMFAAFTWSLVVSAAILRGVLQSAALQQFASSSFASVLAVLPPPQPAWLVLAHTSLLLLSADIWRLKCQFIYFCAIGACDSEETFAAAQVVYSPTQCQLWPLAAVRCMLMHLIGKVTK